MPPPFASPTAASTARTRATIGGLSALVAVSLAVMSALHLSGAIRAVSAPDTASGAGIAEAVIAVVLVAGAVAILRAPVDMARAVGLGTVGFAILGFLVGLTFTLRGGTTADITYHLSTLPVLLLTEGLLVGWHAPRPGDPYHRLRN